MIEMNDEQTTVAERECRRELSRAAMAHAAKTGAWQTCQHKRTKSFRHGWKIRLCLDCGAGVIRDMVHAKVT